MTSRRARNRINKRVSYFDGEAPDIEAAFARLTSERAPKEVEEPEPRLLTMKDGSAIDKREPWQLPSNN